MTKNKLLHVWILLLTYTVCPQLSAAPIKAGELYRLCQATEDKTAQQRCQDYIYGFWAGMKTKPSTFETQAPGKKPTLTERAAQTRGTARYATFQTMSMPICIPADISADTLITHVKGTQPKSTTSDKPAADIIRQILSQQYPCFKKQSTKSTTNPSN